MKSQKELDHLQEWFDDQHQQLESEIFLWIQEHPKVAYSTRASPGNCEICAGSI